MKSVLQVLRSQVFLSLIYLDDILLIVSLEQLSRLNVERTRDFLESLGFILNFEKSNLILSHQCRFLGLDFNSKKFTVELSKEKRETFLNLTIKFRSKSKCKIREVIQCIGLLVSSFQELSMGGFMPRSWNVKNTWRY